MGVSLWIRRWKIMPRDCTIPATSICSHSTLNYTLLNRIRNRGSTETPDALYKNTGISSSKTAQLSTIHSQLMSPNFDDRLTLSIPRNCLPANPLRVRFRAHFDTLSVYRAVV